MIRFYKKTVLYSVLCLTIARALTHLVRVTVARTVHSYPDRPTIQTVRHLSSLPVYKVGALFRATAQKSTSLLPKSFSFPITPAPQLHTSERSASYGARRLPFSALLSLSRPLLASRFLSGLTSQT